MAENRIYYSNDNAKKSREKGNKASVLHLHLSISPIDQSAAKVTRCLRAVYWGTMVPDTALPPSGRKRILFPHSLSVSSILLYLYTVCEED